MIDESGRRQRQAERAQLRGAREAARNARAHLWQLEQAEKQLAAAEAARVATESQAVEDFLDHPLANSGPVSADPSPTPQLLVPKPFVGPVIPSLDELTRQHFVHERHRLNLLSFGSGWAGGLAIALAFGSLGVASMTTPPQAVAMLIAVVPPYAIAGAFAAIGAVLLCLAWRGREAMAMQRAEEAATTELDDKRRQLTNAESAHDANEQARIAALQCLWAGEPAAVQSAIVAALDDLTFPIEIAAHVRMVDAKQFAVEVDLPEIEDLPQETCRVLKSGKLSYKPKTKKALHEQYARFSAGLAFLYAVEVMRAIPTAHTVTVSAFTERVDVSTGQDADQYVVSARFDRTSLAALRLGGIDPLAAIQQFEHRIELGRSGELIPIEPLGSGT